MERRARAVAVLLAPGAWDEVVQQTPEGSTRLGQRTDSSGQDAGVPVARFEGRREVEAVLHAAADVGVRDKGGSGSGLLEGFDGCAVRDVLEENAIVCEQP